MKVLISGGGITGNALAFWLSKLNHDVTVIERFPNLRDTGLQIDLRGHGIEVLRRMGLEQGFRSKQVSEQGLKVVDSSGRRWAYFPANKSGKGSQSFTSDFEIMRGDLCRLLYDPSKARAKYIFGTSIESFEEHDSFVEVRFADGKTDRFDLLVGADGQWSRTRRMMLGSNRSDAIYPVGGFHIGYFTMARSIQEGEEYVATTYMATGGRAVMTRRHSPNAIQVYLICKTNSERLKNARRGDVEEEKEALADIFRGAGWETQAILKSLEVADDFYLERIGLVKLDSWSRGRVTLVGDAAYCPTVFTGMGTTSGLVGAYILAGEIGSHCGRSGKAAIKEGDDTKDGLATALKTYEQKFRPFMEQVQAGAPKDSFWWKLLMPSSLFGITVLNFVLGLVSLLRLDLLTEWFFSENVKDWNLPEYEVMLKN